MSLPDSIRSILEKPREKWTSKERLQFAGWEQANRRYRNELIAKDETKMGLTEKTVEEQARKDEESGPTELRSTAKSSIAENPTIRSVENPSPTSAELPTGINKG